MATTQYIGARYVPLFAEPIEWDKTQQYEPLTIVTHEGNSYTSRQFVPTGIEIDNEAFWALTGNFNAQVEQYRKEVAAYDGRITTAQGTADSAKDTATAAKTSADAANAAVAAEKTRAETKEAEIKSIAETNETNIAHLDAQMAATTGSELLNKITEETNRAKTAESNLVQKRTHMLALGDSFGVDDVSKDKWWHTYLSSYLGLVDHNYCEGYDGFVTRNPVSGKNFLDKAKEAADDNSFANDDVAVVVVYGGLNDRDVTNESSIQNAIENLIVYLHSTFTNAKVYIAGPTTWYAFTQTELSASEFGTHELLMRSLMSIACQNNSAVYLDVWYATLGHANYFAGLTDGNHFTETGSKACAGAMYNLMNGGEVKNIGTVTDVTVDLGSKKVTLSNCYYSLTPHFIILSFVMDNYEAGTVINKNVNFTFGNRYRPSMSFFGPYGLFTNAALVPTTYTNVFASASNDGIQIETKRGTFDQIFISFKIIIPYI